ncbi:hypothetical protein OG787_45435 [Streptomyces sp. NBC_00075]|uniref:hypothetical protein n=1 Tax=Streptomyces sp. NBC_00075 TaxID=2975641 RepID=UPI003244D4FA
MSPPPLDPELGAVLKVLAEHIPPSIALELVPAIRDCGMAGQASDEELYRDRAFEIEDWTVPGPPGAPTVLLLIAPRHRSTADGPLRPRRRAGPR